MQTRKPRVIEVVGPAGAGKSTLCAALAESGNCVRLLEFPDVHQLSNAPFFGLHGLRVVPGLLSASGDGSRQLTRREFAWLSILDGWPGILRKESSTRDGVIALDQGPVYLLTELFELSPAPLKSKGAARLLDTLSARWAPILDRIIWLDAPDGVLAERIQWRDKSHMVKAQSVQSIFRFLDDFRLAYDRTLSRLVSHRADISVLRFDTEKEPPLQIADKVLASIR